MTEKLLFLRNALLAALLGLIIIGILVGGSVWLSSYEEQQPASCNVAVAHLYGTVVYYPAENANSATSALGDGTLDQTAAEDIRQEIETADADPSIKAILLQIDSYGGDPVAGEDIAAALRHATKPTVALIADAGTSAAYWAATGAENIFASANSSVGDIGVTGSYLDQTKQNAQNGLTWESLVAGRYKDMGNPNAPLTPEEKAMIQRDLDIMRNNFISDVAQNRNLSVASVTALADGSSMLGEMALQNGLIDKIGNIYDAESYLNGKIGGEVTLCE